ncbi:MAG: ABC transporter ATP-binding protein, partial [Gemmatimonadetes bacterium]|nr:ABC transporter ATP-binding protein [Gemmatimonadota bacterium]NIT67726.1 ABC transporter ATP-binding protein [Gemmatimonadota bacterium]NIU53868.1 peptide ABC transporter ATP-binding protein [Gemmatimonadota bacterium]NIV24424.1 peptide ABC transporter ATP-binding protein [Gemmatimonadota bacterium]NIW37494.1 peptide ABC transporter ATP-binding protein [Gemmatimonadota bacterium]
TVTCLSILRLIEPPGRIEDGSRIRFRDRELTELPEAEMRSIRGNEISMIFQEPMTSLNPVLTVGDQIAEAIRSHRRTRPAEAWERAVAMLDLVGIPDPAARAGDYPHEFSG